MMDKKIIIALLTVIAVGIATVAGIQVKQYNEKQRVLKEAKDAAEKESQEWQKVGNRTNEEIRSKTGKNNKGPMGDL